MFGLSKKINKTRAWKRLEKQAAKMRKIEMRDMFDKDPKRAEKYTLSFEDMRLDFSKNRIDDRTFACLLGLAKEAGLGGKIEQMFQGQKSIRPRTEPFCIWLCATATIIRFMWTGLM